MSRYDCQVAGLVPEGGTTRACPAFSTERHVCTHKEPCVYKLELEIRNEELAQREKLGLPPQIAARMEMVKSGAERLKELWHEELFRDVLTALDIADQYRPSSGKYVEAQLNDLHQLNTHIIHLQALGLRIAALVGETRGTAEELDAHRHIMHGRKSRAIRESYETGVRSGRVTDQTIEHDVRCDPEYQAMFLAVSTARRQTEVLANTYDGIKELVNALKYQINTLQEEMKRSGR